MAAGDPEILYVFNELIDMASNIGKAQGNVNQLADDVKSATNTLAAVWGGASSQGWQGVQTKWSNAVQELTTALTQLSTAVSTAESDMSNAEAKNLAMWA